MATLERFGPAGHDLVVLDETAARSRSARARTTTSSSTTTRPCRGCMPGSSTSARRGASPTSAPRTAPPSTASGCSPRGPCSTATRSWSVGPGWCCATPTARGDDTTAPLRAAAGAHARRAAGARRAVPARAVGAGVHAAVVGAGDRRRPVRHRVGGQAAPRPALRQVRHPHRGRRVTTGAARQRGDPERRRHDAAISRRRVPKGPAAELVTAGTRSPTPRAGDRRLVPRCTGSHGRRRPSLPRAASSP